jgi:hypothetical protein
MYDGKHKKNQTIYIYVCMYSNLITTGRITTYQIRNIQLENTPEDGLLRSEKCSATESCE